MYLYQIILCLYGLGLLTRVVLSNLYIMSDFSWLKTTNIIILMAAIFLYLLQC